ncbi:MAG: EF-P lysine aminoacylase GenX [Proteobacteria bacterium]|nr:EF-P lysine aminoacylase GenX [Pseudomonadota bacterium]
MRRRATVVTALRAYFDAEGVCEVATPLLSPQATTEPTLRNLAVAQPFAAGREWYLRTSPEAAMKRLLAAGSGDIYQLGPVFRADERGRHHLTEFTLLEWYRLGFSLDALMDDVAAALAAAGFTRAIARVSYDELFAVQFGAAPHAFDDAQLAALAAERGLCLAPADRHDRALLLDGLYACVLEPALATMGAVFVYAYPPELRAYARLTGSAPPHAARFELVVDGLELGNGYHEIIDADEQGRCFAVENTTRAARGLPQVAPDEAWLAALAHGMPAASGVALGVERLLMVLGLGARIDEVSLFAHELDEQGGGDCSSLT